MAENSIRWKIVPHSLTFSGSFFLALMPEMAFVRSLARSPRRSRFGEFHGGALFKSENAEWGRTKKERKVMEGRQRGSRSSLCLYLSLSLCVRAPTDFLDSLQATRTKLEERGTEHEEERLVTRTDSDADSGGAVSGSLSISIHTMSTGSILF